MKRLLFLTVLPLLIIMGCNSGCKTLRFTDPVPSSGEVVAILPAFLEGRFLRETEEGAELMEIQRADDQHIKILLSSGITLDSLNSLVEGMRETRSGVVLMENKIIISTCGMVPNPVLKEYTVVDGYYFDSLILDYEINLNESCLKADAEDSSVQTIEFRLADGSYFLNVLEDEYWFLTTFKKTLHGMIICKAEIKDEELLRQDGVFSSLSGLKRLNEGDWIASPSDEELFQLLESDDLLVSEDWKRVRSDSPTNIGLLSFCIFLAVCFIMLAWDLIKQKKA